MTDPIFVVEPGGALHGRARVPGDKSISHRAIMFGSLAEGVTTITGFLEGEDCLATLKAFRAMGVHIDGPEEGRVVVQGVGLHGLRAPDGPLDMGNSGTSMRLMSGILAGQAFDVVLTGDASLTLRPTLADSSADAAGNGAARANGCPDRQHGTGDSAVADWRRSTIDRHRL